MDDAGSSGTQQQQQQEESGRSQVDNTNNNNTTQLYDNAVQQLAQHDALLDRLTDETLMMQMEVATIMVDMVSMTDILIFKHLEAQDLDLVTQIGLQKYQNSEKKQPESDNK